MLRTFQMPLVYTHLPFLWRVVIFSTVIGFAMWITTKVLDNRYDHEVKGHGQNLL